MASVPPTTWTPTASSPSTPSTAAPSPSATERAHRGLTITTTIGVGIGVAGVCIIIFAIVFICIRRRRRKWGKKRKEQGDPEIKGDTPDEEILKKVKSDEGSTDAAELGNSEMKMAELGGGGTGTGEKDMKLVDDVRELHAESDPVELAAQEHVAELGEGGTFIAELDSTEIARRKTIKAQQQKKNEEEDEGVEKTPEIAAPAPEKA